MTADMAMTVWMLLRRSGSSLARWNSAVSEKLGFSICSEPAAAFPSQLSTYCCYPDLSHCCRVPADRKAVGTCTRLTTVHQAQIPHTTCEAAQTGETYMKLFEPLCGRR